MTYEKSLARAIKAKNSLEIEKAFEQIYYKYGKLVAFVISKYVFNKNDIEELVNDVFLNFSRVLYSIKLDNIKYYLVVQAKNAAINFVKKNSKKRIEYVDDWIEENNEIENKSLVNNVIQDMKKCLSSEEIKIIILHSIYCYSFVELAKKYNRPTTTISSMFHRAIKKMRKFYIKGEDCK